MTVKVSQKSAASAVPQSARSVPARVDEKADAFALHLEKATEASARRPEAERQTSPKAKASAAKAAGRQRRSARSGEAEAAAQEPVQSQAQAEESVGEVTGELEASVEELAVDEALAEAAIPVEPTVPSPVVTPAIVVATAEATRDGVESEPAPEGAARPLPRLKHQAGTHRPAEAPSQARVRSTEDKSGVPVGGELREPAHEETDVTATERPVLQEPVPRDGRAAPEAKTPFHTQLNFPPRDPPRVGPVADEGAPEVKSSPSAASELAAAVAERPAPDRVFRPVPEAIKRNADPAGAASGMASFVAPAPTAEGRVLSAEFAPAAQESPVHDAEKTFDQVVLGLRTKMDGANQKAQIELNPPNLGRLQVAVEVSNGLLTAQFHASTEVVRDLLSSRMDQLRSVLEGQGIAVDKLAVTASAGTAEVRPGGASADAGHDGRSGGAFAQERHSPRQGHGETFARMWRAAQEKQEPVDLLA